MESLSDNIGARPELRARTDADADGAAIVATSAR